MTSTRTLLNLCALTAKSVIDYMNLQINIILGLTFFLLIFTNIQVSQATEKKTLAPGEIRVDFISEHEINLHAFKATRIEILNQLSKYITLELIVDSQLNEQVTFEFKNQSLAQVLIHLLADHNHVVWYRSNSVKQRQTTTLRLHEIKLRPEIKKLRSADSEDSILTNRNPRASDKSAIEIIEQLGDIKNTASIKQLEKIIRYANTKQKIEACNSLGDIGTTRAVSILRRLVQDDNPRVRQEAVYALGDISSEQALKTLALAINNSVSDIRLLAIAELAQINSDESVRALEKAVKDRNPQVRLTAVQALGEQNTDKSKELLWKLTQSNELPLSIAANEILTRLNQQ